MRMMQKSNKMCFFTNVVFVNVTYYKNNIDKIAEGCSITIHSGFSFM